MLPTSKDFSSFSPIGVEKLMLKNSTTALNVNAIVLEGKLARITTAIAMVGWASKMKVTLAGCTDPKNNGTFTIERLDTANNYIYIDNPNAVAQAGAAGTATLAGYVNTSMVETGAPVKNGKYEIIGWEYSQAYGNGTIPNGYYLLEGPREDSWITAIQVVNTHASLGGLTVEAKWSLNGIDWVAFTPNKIVTVDAGLSDIILVDFNVRGMKVRLEVTNIAGASFYVIAV